VVAGLAAISALVLWPSALKTLALSRRQASHAHRHLPGAAAVVVAVVAAEQWPSGTHGRPLRRVRRLPCSLA